MIRTARRIAPLLRSLLLGGLALSATAATATTLVGCADENAPDTWVKRLDDPATRPAAVKRLIQFFEDAMTRDGKDRNGPTVKPLLDMIVEPLTQTCVSGDLDDKTRSNLIKFMADARDPRTEACLVKTLKEYKPDQTEEDVRWVTRAVGSMKLKAAGEPLLQVFMKMRPSKPKADAIYRDVHDALVDIADPAWEPQLLALLNRPLPDRKDGGVVKDEMFWQITAAEILGATKSANAVKPLIKVTLSPLKVEASSTALNALLKIGKPTVGPAIALLKGEDKDLLEYSKVENLKSAAPDGKPTDAQTKAAASAYLGTAATIVAALGRDECTGPLIDTLAKSDDALNRVLLAKELVNVPASPDVVKAFEAAFEKTPLDFSSPLIGSGREFLLDKASWFFDASMVPWLVKMAKEAKGDAEDVDGLRAQTLLAAIKIMKADQVGLVDELAKLKTAQGAEVGKAFEKEMKTAKTLLEACGDKVDCWVAKLGEPASQQKDTLFQGIKSVYMVGVLGSPDVKKKLMDLMPKLTASETRGLAGVVIDHFSPKGDADIAKALQKILDDAEASKDAGKMANSSSLKQVVYRLNARAQ